MTPGALGASGCLLGVSWVPLGVSRVSLGVSWVPPVFILGASGMSPRCLLENHGKLQEINAFKQGVGNRFFIVFLSPGGP